MKFEGEFIDVFTLSMRALKQPITKPLMRGELLELKFTVEVVEVSHRIDGRTGQMVRDHLVKIVEVEQ